MKAYKGKKIFAIFGICFMITFMLLTSGCRLLPKEEIEEVPALVQPPQEELITYQIVEGPIHEELRSYARVGAAKEQTLYFSVPGRIQELPVKLDDEVRKGQIIAVLETGELQFDLKHAKIALQQQELYYQQMAKAGETAQRLAKLNVEMAQNELDRLTKRQEDSVLRAPFQGTITTVTGVRGRTVEAFQPIAVLSDTQGLELIAEIDDSQVRIIRPGTRVRIDNGGEGQVTFVGKSQNANDSDQWLAHIRIAGRKLTINDSYTVSFILRSVAKALLIPNSAVREDVNGRKYLRVLDGNTRREVYIKVGIQNDTHTQILEGAEAGMTVIGK